MTTFDDKEKAAENKYAHDKEMEFKVQARAHKLLGLWVAGKVGLSGAAAEEYAASLVTQGLHRHDPKHLLESIRTHIRAHEIHLSDHDIHEQMHKAQQAAREQVLRNQ